MWMRIAAALAVTALATLVVTCGGDVVAGSADSGSSPDTTGTAPTPTPSPTSTDGGTSPVTTATIACALGGAASFGSTCTVERVEVDDAKLLTVFHPDGEFWQFEQLADGSGLAVVAGADPLTQSLNGDTLEIAIAGNRYRFPVTTQ